MSIFIFEIDIKSVNELDEIDVNHAKEALRTRIVAGSNFYTHEYIKIVSVKKEK